MATETRREIRPYVWRHDGEVKAVCAGEYAALVISPIASFVPGAGGSFASNTSGVRIRWIWPRDRTRSTISCPR